LEKEQIPKGMLSRPKSPSAGTSTHDDDDDDCC